MLALGGMLIGVTIVALGLLLPICRDPDGPSWVRRSLIGELMTVALVTMLALGLGHVGAGIVRQVEQGVDPIDIGLFLAVLAAVVAVWPRLRVRARLRAIELKAAAAGPRIVTSGPDEPTPIKPVPTTPRRSQRKAA